MFGVWELTVRAGFVTSDRLPAFSNVVEALVVASREPAFIVRVLQSFTNLSFGIVIACIIALPMGIMAGMRSMFDYAFTPIVMIGGALPELALLPLLVMWLGPGNFAAVAMAALVSFFPLFFTVREGTKDIPSDLFHVTSIFKSPNLSVLTRVILPAISPHLLTGLRLSYEFVWEIVLALEIIASVSGIGLFIDHMVKAGSLELAFAGIMAVGTLAVVVDRTLFGFLEGRVRRWIG
jgi:ABC-type nitrate/sulfonate/bicarbonate transport system permease component